MTATIIDRKAIAEQMRAQEVPRDR